MKKIYFVFAIFTLLLTANFVVPVKAQPNKKQVEQARKLALEGDKFYRQKNYRQAVDRFERAAAMVPNFNFPPIFYYNKAVSHFSLQQYDPALESYERALNQGYTPQLNIYRDRWKIYYLKKDYDNALRDAEEVSKADPNDSSILLTMGDMYAQKNMDNEALAKYEKAALLLPNNGDLQYSIAFLYAKMGDSQKQGVSALKAIQNNTRYLGESWFLVGNSFQADRKLKDAADAYEKALSAKPELTTVYSNLAQIYQTQNRLNDAINIVKKGIDYSPQDGNLYITLTWLLSLADRNVEAIGAGKKAIQYAPNEYMGYTNLCRAYAEAKQFDTALQHCSSALNLKPNDGETNYYLGRIYFSQNKRDLGATYYKKAVTGLIEFTKLNPDYPDGFYLLGNAYLASNQIQNAVSAYRKCLDLNPNFAKVVYNLGYSYVLLGDKKSAKDQYNLLVKLDPDSAASLLKEINK